MIFWLVLKNIICGKMYVASSIVCFYEIVTHKMKLPFMLQDKQIISNSTSVATKHL